MSARRRPRFDREALRALAGDTVFARGEAYHRDGQVELLAIEPDRVVAQVAGSEDYRSLLTGRGKPIAGSCSCPAFADRGFCKHLVAVALAANASGDNPAAEGAGALTRIRAHLQGQGVEALVALILDLAERDAALFRRLDLAAAATSADDRTLETRLRKALDGATRTGGYVDYRNAADWAAGVDTVLDSLATLAAGPRAALVLGLALRAIDRIEAAIEEIDDSDGHSTMLLERARDIHLTAAKAAPPEPLSLARDLYARETAGGFDTFYDASSLYADVLGPAGLAEYRRRATAAWAALPPRAAKAGARVTYDGAYDGLKRILDRFAERDGDVETRIALRSKDLSAPWDYLQLAEFCRAQGRPDAALRHAREGLWVFEDGRPDERLVNLAVDLLAEAGQKAEAAMLLQQAFEKAPSLELYTRLRRLGDKPGCARLIAWLEARLAKEARTRWHSPADLLIRILLAERRFAAAWAAVGTHGASLGIREALARASATAHPQEALAVYAERVEHLATGGGDPAYNEAVGLIGQMAALRSASEQSAYLVALKARFGRKRNFMKLLG